MNISKYQKISSRLAAIQNLRWNFPVGEGANILGAAPPVFAISPLIGQLQRNYHATSPPDLTTNEFHDQSHPTVTLYRQVYIAHVAFQIWVYNQSETNTITTKSNNQTQNQCLFEQQLHELSCQWREPSDLQLSDNYHEETLWLVFNLVLKNERWHEKRESNPPNITWTFDWLHSAVSMIGGYFGMMGGAFCVGSLVGAVRSEVEVLYSYWLPC